MNDFKPMLAATVNDVTQLRFPLLASPKLDGVRAVIRNGVVCSRNLKPIPSRFVQQRYGLQVLEGLDGELIYGAPISSTCFRDTTSAVMTADSNKCAVFYVFDLVAQQHFAERLYQCTKIAGQRPFQLKLVKHRLIHDVDSLLVYEENLLQRGYEGVMLRDPNGLYKNGRSTLKEHGLMKLKRFMDSEALVLGMYEQQRNDNAVTKDELGRTKRSSHKANKVGKATLGGFHVRDLKTGVEFDIGTGFDDALRQTLWNSAAKLSVGRIVKYKYFPTGCKDKPRFPVFLGFRDLIDL